MFQQAIKNEWKALIENKSKFVLVSAPKLTRPVGRNFLREGAIQRGDGPNESGRREPLGGSGGHATPGNFEN